MPTNIIMPALEMAQDTGKILRWLKREGDAVTKGEPIMEIETDKVTVEIEATATGTLANVTAREGDVIPVGQTIALIVDSVETLRATSLPVSPVARKIAEDHGVDLARVKPGGGRVEKADVLAYLALTPSPSPVRKIGEQVRGAKIPASPQARRLASERNVDLATLRGSGPDGAIIASDVPTAPTSNVQRETSNFQLPTSNLHAKRPISTIWRVMAERMTTNWTTVPHFYVVREVDARALVELRGRIASLVEKRVGVKPTYTDLLVKLIAHTLRDHPRVNASWVDGNIKLNDEINIGIATAIEDGLIVPVVHRADTLTMGDIATRRKDMVARAGAGKLKPADIAGGTFTLTNLGMYNVDAFNAIINAPQAAILAVGRIAERVVAVKGQAVVRPMMTLTLSCDHRVVDGARAAQFLDALANLIEEPWALLA
ncbi:MAG: 2-oxo acid dehydrogenase subunit E2 [Chloroflexi bacterium]|nr:2-oxo acid dehydrogenase subunit E2 [Chloroflexota bacterium]